MVAGGTGGAGNSGSNNDGGAGGVGRIRVEYCNTLSGTTNPPASVQKLTCYIAEKTSNTNVHFTVPDAITGGQNYVMQFGRHFAFGAGGGTIMTPTRLLAQNYANATLDALITNVGAGGALNLQVQAGAQTIYSASQTITQPTDIPIGDFAGALNAYLASQPANTSIDVPMTVTLDHQADVILTDLALTPGANADVSIASNDIAFGTSSPTEGTNVPITLTLHNTGNADSGGLTAAFFATPTLGSAWYIGSAYVPDVPANGTAQTSIVWNTLGFTGSVPVRVVVDPYQRVAETNRNNNSTATIFNVLSRPDLSVPRIVPSDPEPTAGEAISVAVAVRNAGQTNAMGAVLAVYDGNPSSGGTLLATRTFDSLAGTEVTSTLSWLPTRAGPHQLFAIADPDNAINESDKTNNQTLQSIYVGLLSPILIDSGGPSDPPYTSTLGYGYLTAGSTTSDLCGTQAYQTIRSGVANTLDYRFDHLLPGHFYHLDVTLYECDGSGRREQVQVDGMPMSPVVDLSDAQPHRLSLRLDPALYADHSIVATIEETQGYDAIVSEVRLFDVDYRYTDAGALTEQPYSAARGYGYLDGVRNAPYGLLPLQTQRRDAGDSDVLYRFDGLNNAKQYLLNLSFYHQFGTTQIERMGIDSTYLGPTFTVPYSTPTFVTVTVPLAAYAGDGSIITYITKTNALVGGFVNEIALEEITQPTVPTVADLAVSASATPSTVFVGQSITYTAIITNAGPDVASNTQLIAALPGGLVFTSSPNNCAGTNTVTCNLGTLNNGQTTSAVIVATALLTGTQASTFNITSEAGDLMTGNNSAQVSVSVTSAAQYHVYLPLITK